MYNWNNPQYTYYHSPSAPLPVHIPINPNPIPIPNRIVRPPHISFTYKPHVDNSYIEPVNLNANGWQQPNTNVKFQQGYGSGPTFNGSIYGYPVPVPVPVHQNIIVQAHQQDLQSPREQLIKVKTPPIKKTAQEPPKDQSYCLIQSESKTNQINDSLSIYEPNQLINKLRSSLDQNKLSLSGNDFAIEYNNKNNENYANETPQNCNIPPASLRKTKERDSGLKQIEQSAIEILSSSSASNQQNQLGFQFIESRYKAKMKRKDLNDLEWVKLL